MIGSGPIGAIMASANFECMMQVTFAWSVTQLTDDRDTSAYDWGKIAIQVSACAMSPTAGRALLAFNTIVEVLELAYLYRQGKIIGFDLAAGLIGHSLSFVGGGGLSRHAASARATIERTVLDGKSGDLANHGCPG